MPEAEDTWAEETNWDIVQGSMETLSEKGSMLDVTGANRHEEGEVFMNSKAPPENYTWLTVQKG